MRIANDPYLQNTPAREASKLARTAPVPGGAPAGASSSLDNGTKVTISGRARELSGLAASFDTAKVTQLRTAFAANAYTIDPHRIAQSMMEKAAS